MLAGVVPMIRTVFLLVSVAALALAGCSRDGGENAELAALDESLANDAAGAPDPALTAALEDQILVDPDLAQQSQRDVARPAGGPAGAQMPAEVMPTPATAAETGRLLSAPAPAADTGASPSEAERITLGALAQSQARGACEGKIGYSYQWAARMPADMPLYPRARVSEAAGADAAACTRRVVGFATAATVQQVVDFHYTRARQARYSAEHLLSGSEHRLGGTRGDDAFMLFARPRRGGGTEGEIIVNTGR